MTDEVIAHVALVEELYLAIGNSSVSRIELAGVTFLLNQTLLVNRSLAIVATEPGAVLDGMNSTRVFKVHPWTARLELTNVTVTRGFTTGTDGGSAIDNWGTLLATNCTFSDHVALRGHGGAIRNWRAATLVGCDITRNFARNGGGIDNRGGSTLLTLRACRLSHNVVEQSGGGLSNQGTAVVTDSLPEYFLRRP